jgi:ribosomal protein S18 acetylase RimI-like enzyme
LNVRPLTASDAAAFQELRLRALQDCPEAFSSSYAEERGLALEEIATRLVPNEGRRVFGAFLERELVGVLGFQRETMRKLAHKAFIWGMYVAPAHRRNGVGRQLLAAALELAQSLPALRQVKVSVNSSNAAAVALYERVGFRGYGVEPNALLVNGELYDETQMVCHIRGGA